MTDKKGKERKRYRYEDMMTPYEKFRSLSKPGQYLKKGITLKQLDAFAREMNDNDAAEQLPAWTQVRVIRLEQESLEFSKEPTL